MHKTLACKLFNSAVAALLLVVLAVVCGEIGISALEYKHDVPTLVAPGGPVPYPTGGGTNGGNIAANSNA